MTTCCLLAAALALGQNYDRSEWQLTPRFESGLELTYKGTFTEESLIPGVQYLRRYSLETLFFVQSDQSGKAEAFLLTSLGLTPGKEAQSKTQPGYVRLTAVRFGRHGRLLADEATQSLLTVPLNGPPLVEAGAFVDFPAVKVNKQSYWEEIEEGRGLRDWSVAGAERVSGVTCVKLVGTQQSKDWKEPRADSTAWRRRDLIWFSPQVGVVFRVERTIEKRDPARSEPTQRLSAAYELESRLRFSGNFYQDRVQEIAKTRKFQAEAEPLLREPSIFRGQIEALERRVVKHLEETTPTPYRKALVHLQTRLGQALTGQLPPAVGAEPAVERGPVGIGKKSPDFIVSDLISEKTKRFYDLLGQPILILYYDPTTPTGKEALKFVQKLCDEHGDDILVLGMAVSNNTVMVREQHEEMGLTFPVLDGNCMHRTFGVDGTPRVIILDRDGLVRFAFTGWGFHSPREVAAEIKKCLK